MMVIHRCPSATDPSHHSPAFLTSSDPTFPSETSPNTLQTTSTPEPKPSSSSSRTRLHRDNDNDRDSATLIEETIRRSGEVEEAAEREVERYGGDDPRDPEEEEWNAYKHRDNKDRKTEGRVSVEEEETECGSRSEKEKDPNLVGWDGPDDPENPQNWSKTYKCFVTGICSIITFNVTFASSAPSTAASFIAEEFNSSAEVSYLVTSVFLLGYCFGPIFWGPGSELLGRKPIYVIPLTCYTLLFLGQALAQNMATLLVTRFLGGFFACSPLTNGGGLLADMWDPVGRGPATGAFTAVLFLGPSLGPLVAGFIVESTLGWRWVFWVMMIFAGFVTILAALFMPETYAPVILHNKAKRLRKASPSNASLYAESERQDWAIKPLLHRTLYRPFVMLASEPILLLVTIYLSAIYGVLYGLFEAFPIIFIERHNLSISQNGLIFLSLAIGATLGALLNQLLLNHYPHYMTYYRGYPPPEKRLYGAMIAGPSLVVGSLWLGWSGQYEVVPWYVPALSGVLIGAGIILIFVSFLSYLIDTYMMYAASAFAANTIIRSAVGAAFPLFTVQMYHKLGINWASTLIAGIALVLAPIPFLFFKYGARIRQGSRFAPCTDLQIKKEIEEEEAMAREKEQGIKMKGGGEVVVRGVEV